MIAFLGAVAAVPAGSAAAQGDAQESAAERCFEHHKFGAQPVDVAKTADRQTVLAQVSWGYHDAIGCYLTLDNEALSALQAAPPPQSLPDAETEASKQCFQHHQFGQRPVDVAKSADRQTVLARLSWGYHDAIGCYLTLDDTALATLRANAQPDPTETTQTPASPPTTIFSSNFGIDICALTPDGSIICGVFSESTLDVVVAPSGPFESITPIGGLASVCGIRVDQTAACLRWEVQRADGSISLVEVELDIPEKPFTDFTLVWDRIDPNGAICGLEADVIVACWEYQSGGSGERPRMVNLDLPDGQFTSIDGRFRDIADSGATWCGHRTDNSVACWYWHWDGGYDENNAQSRALVELDSPNGRYIQITQDYTEWVAQGSDRGLRGHESGKCGLRPDMTIACWNWGRALDHGGSGPPVWDRVFYEFTDVPEGQFAKVAAYKDSYCGLRTNQNVVCWSWAYPPVWDDDGNVVQPLEELDIPGGPLTDFSVVEDAFWCGSRAGLIVACWDWQAQWDNAGNLNRVPVELDLPAGQFSVIRAFNNSYCGLQDDLIVACWSWSTKRDDEGINRRTLSVVDLPEGQFRDVLSIQSQWHDFWCGIRADQTVACWPEDRLPSGWIDVRLAQGQVVAIEATTYGPFAIWCALRTNSELICSSALDPGFVSENPEG